MIAKVVIKTIGRPTLNNAILSAHREGFETIVVSDNPKFDRASLWDLRDKIEKTYRRPAINHPDEPTYFFTLPKKCGNYGAVAANVGAAMNDAKYTIFLDDDDEFVEGAGEYMRATLSTCDVDLWLPGLEFGPFQLCNDPDKGFIPGNVGMVTYRTSLLQKFPMQYCGPHAETPTMANHFDFYHAKECVNRGATYDWYGKCLYKVRPKLDGTNGRGGL